VLALCAPCAKNQSRCTGTAARSPELWHSQQLKLDLHFVHKRILVMLHVLETALRSFEGLVGTEIAHFLADSQIESF
jgi:hypothetical protein